MSYACLDAFCGPLLGLEVDDCNAVDNPVIDCLDICRSLFLVDDGDTKVLAYTKEKGGEVDAVSVVSTNYAPADDTTMATVEGVFDLSDDSTTEDDDVINMEDPQVSSVAIAEVDLTCDLSNEETNVIMDKEPQTPSTIAAQAVVACADELKTNDIIMEELVPGSSDLSVVAAESGVTEPLLP